MAGYFDSPILLDAILSDRKVDRILNNLERLPVGAGNEYRDLVFDCLVSSLSELIDVPLFPARGGRGDIELPIYTEVLDKYPLWNHWGKRYDIRSIIVETKNEKIAASDKDVSQLEGYFSRSKLGRFGFFVARMGFTSNAQKTLAEMAKDGDKLIIPLDQHRLSEFAQASKKSPFDSMKYLRRQQTLLLQSA